MTKLIMEFGGKADIVITEFPGILIADSQIESVCFINKIKQKIIESPWEIRYCLRLIPIQIITQTNIPSVKNSVLKLKGKIGNSETFRITIEKRGSKISSRELISEIASQISNKVSLENPDWVILIEILGPETGVAIVKKDAVLSVEKLKRSLSE